MERRSEVRVMLDQAVCVTALRRNIPPLRGRTVDMSGRGIRILLSVPISQGDTVKIELDDALLLGEVCYCLPQNGDVMIGVEIDQALRGLTSLQRLHKALFNEATVQVDSRTP